MLSEGDGDSAGLRVRQPDRIAARAGKQGVSLGCDVAQRPLLECRIQPEPVGPGLVPAGPPTTVSRSTTKTSVEPAGINGEGDCLP